MRIGKFHIEDVTGEFQESDIDTIFEISVQHKYWYLWSISIIFGSWSKYIQIIRTDWNKCYKTKCLNYIRPVNITQSVMNVRNVLRKIIKCGLQEIQMEL